MTLDEVFTLVKQLSILDQVKLIERIAPEIEQGLQPAPLAPRKSLWGLCADLGSAPSSSEIDEARQAGWADFPRDID